MEPDRLATCVCCKHTSATDTNNVTQQRRKLPLLLALSCLLLLAAPIVALATSPAAASNALAAAASSSPAPSPAATTTAATAATSAAVDDPSLLADLDPDEFDAALPFLEPEHTLHTEPAHHAPDDDASEPPAAADASDPSAADASTTHPPLTAEPAVTAAVLETGALTSCLAYVTSFFSSPDATATMPPRSARRIGATATKASSSSGSDSWLSSLSHTVSNASWPSLLAASAAATVGLGALLWLLSSDSDSNPCTRSSRRPASKRGPRREEPQPLLIELPQNRRGRVQGMDWVAKSLKKDQDGDEAHEFLGPF